MRRSGKIMRPVLRFVASVLITSGLLMLVDAALTVTWQEPVSAFFAQQEQNALNEELTRDAPQVERDLQAVAPIRDVRKRLRRLAALAHGRARTGHAIGTIRIPRLDRHYAVVQGTDTDSLRKGPGHYPDTSFPGEGGTVAIAGHRTTYLAPFRTIDKLKAGDAIVLDMPYGTFSYAVEKTDIVDPSQTSVTDPVPGAERLVLSACHPLYSASQRIIVFARLKSESPRQ
jgi:sortase A